MEGPGVAAPKSGGGRWCGLVGVTAVGGVVAVSAVEDMVVVAYWRMRRRRARTISTRRANTRRARTPKAADTMVATPKRRASRSCKSKEQNLK